jgi:hypothetical protein
MPRATDAHEHALTALAAAAGRLAGMLLAQHPNGAQLLEGLDQGAWYLRLIYDTAASVVDVEGTFPDGTVQHLARFQYGDHVLGRHN